MASELTLDGYEALMKRLALAEEGMRDRISKAALREGAKDIQESISKAVHVSSKNEEHIRDDITIGRLTRTDTGWKVNIGPGKKTAWRAKFLELGHMKPGGKGRVPAFPFMEPGLEDSQGDFMRTVAGVVRREL